MLAFNRFLERINESDILQWAITQRPNPDWICVLVTNVTFFLNRTLQHPIGCVGINLPTYVKRNKAVIGLEKDHHSAVYRDNLCLFRCLALHLGREAAALYAEYSDKDVHDLLVSRWTTSIELKPSSKRTYACMSLSRPSKRRRRQNVSDVRYATTRTRCT